MACPETSSAGETGLRKICAAEDHISTEREEIWIILRIREHLPVFILCVWYDF
jgi:hypothetical protein